VGHARLEARNADLKPKLKTSNPKLFPVLRTILRLLAWFILFLGATFCWIVLIEHGPDDFVEGCKIEAANFRAIVTRVVSPPVTAPSAAATP
jgi:hypothetical protein